jgi:multidrug efflux pump subunit AcrA (membrane-fusion protein)
MKIKKPILTAAAVCLAAALVVLTFLSRTIMTANQAEVIYARPEKKNILTSRDLTGVVEYEDTYELAYDIPLKIIDVFVSPGYSVGANKALMEIDARELALELKKKEFEVLQARRDNTGDEPGQLRQEIAEGELALFLEKYPTDGKIRTGFAGTVYSVNAAPGDTTAPGASLVSVSGRKSAASAVFYLPEDDAAFFAVGDSAILYYTETYDFEGVAQAVSLAKNSSISAKQFVPRDNIYKFYVPVQSEYLLHGQQIQLKITNKSPVYDAVVPCGALHRGTDERYFVYVLKKRDGLFGDEFCPEIVNVSVMYENGVGAAVNNINLSRYDSVVVWASGLLVPGEAVRVLN